MIRSRKTLFAALLLSATAALADETMQADKQAVNQACATDAQTAGCGSEQAGTGLIKCLSAYHKSHPEWKESASCTAARKTLNQEHKALKAQKSATSTSSQIPAN